MDCVAFQVSLSMGFSRQEYWSRFPCPLPGYLPDPGWNLHLFCLLHWQVGSLPLVPPGNPWCRAGPDKVVLPAEAKNQALINLTKLMQPIQHLGKNFARATWQVTK